MVSQNRESEVEPEQKKKRRIKRDQFEGEDRNSLLDLEKEHTKKGYIVVARKPMNEPVEGIPRFDTVLVGLLGGKPTFSFIKRKDSGRAPPKFRRDQSGGKPPTKKAAVAKREIKPRAKTVPKRKAGAEPRKKGKGRSPPKSTRQKSSSGKKPTQPKKPKSDPAHSKEHGKKREAKIRTLFDF